MIKKIDEFVKKFSYQWYRREYLIAHNISLYCSWSGILVLLTVMIVSKIKPITEDGAFWLLPLSFIAVELIIVGLIVSGLFVVIDKHEKNLNSRGEENERI